MAEGRRKRASAASLIVTVVVVGAGAAAIAMGITATASSPRRTSGPGTPTACITPLTASPATAPAALGRWPFHLLAHGTFPAVAPSSRGSVVALQACGREESSLRVVELSGREPMITSAAYVQAAPVASSVLSDDAGVWFGEGRLALGGPRTEPPYHLSVRELASSDLRSLRSVSLGRGYGIELVAGRDGAVIASTGRQLISLSGTGKAIVLASFPKVVVQHVALVPGSDSALVSVFTPTASPPRPSTSLALVDLADGRTLSSVALPASGEVESIAVGPTTALAAVSTGTSTTVDRFAFSPALHQVATTGHAVQTQLTPLTLAPASSRTILAFGSTTMDCLSAADGTVGATGALSGPGELVTAVAAGSPAPLAVVPAGIGVVTLPARCR